MLHVWPYHLPIRGKASSLPRIANNANAVEGSYQLTYRVNDAESVLDAPLSPASPEGISVFQLAAKDIPKKQVVAANRMRIPQAPEDCFAVNRRSGEGESDVVIEMIGAEQLTDNGTHWNCSKARFSREVWHGAAVISSRDEKVIGILLINENGVQIAPLTDFTSGTGQSAR